MKLFKPKFLKIILSSLLLLAVISLSISTMPASAATSSIYYVTASAGETYETVGINYHCDYENSEVKFSTNANLSNATTVQVTSTSWSVAQGADTNTGFDARYVCNAQLTGLKANTKYYYQISIGAIKSSIYSFTTANENSHKSSVLFLTDTQSADLNSFKRVNKVIEMLKSKTEQPNLAIMTGDIVDRGGYEAQWDAYFEGVTAFNDMLLATIPGNHEYYHDNGSSYVDPSFYNQFFNNPKNGPESRLNSSYYFKYDNILFIMLDIIGIMNQNKPENVECLKQHQAWFKQVVEENPSQWIIVGSHAGAISAGTYASDASWVRNNFQDIFEECQVDLALSGHEHIYIRKDLSYNNSTDEALGVTYLVGPAAGGKQYPANNTDGLSEVIARDQSYSGNILNFDGDKLTVDYYFEDGTKKTSFTLNAKRTASIETVTPQEVEDSINFNYVEEENRVYVRWTEKLWRNATLVELTGSNNWSSPIMSSYSNFHIIRNVYDGNLYNYTLKITMNDSTVVTKDYSLNLTPETKTYQITYDSNRGEMPTNYPTSYANATGVDLPVPTRDGYLFVGWVDEEGQMYRKVEPLTNKDLNLTAEWFRGEETKTITYTLNGGTNPSDAPEFYYNVNGLDVLPTPTRRGYKFVGWKLGDNIVTSIEPLYNRNIVLNAQWEKEKGCKKSSAEYLISSISAISLAIFILKKKK